jgi:hypothetical protein
MGHSTFTHASNYSTERVGSKEAHFDAYNSTIGDTSHQLLKCPRMLSLSDHRRAMKLRFPNSLSLDESSYLSLQQKDLVEFDYGRGPSKKQHCLDLLSPGDEKSESHIIPTIARSLANQECKTIIHISPYSFLDGYQFANASAIFEQLRLDSNISLLCFTERGITQVSHPQELVHNENLPGILFLSLDAMDKLFTYHYGLLES